MGRFFLEQLRLFSDGNFQRAGRKMKMLAFVYVIGKVWLCTDLASRRSAQNSYQKREREAKRKNRLEMEISKGLRARRRFYGPPPRPFDVHLEIKKNFTLNLFINQGNIDDFF